MLKYNLIFSVVVYKFSTSSFKLYKVQLRKKVKEVQDVIQEGERGRWKVKEGEGYEKEREE